MTDDIIHKTCTKCKENLPASEFHKNKSKRDGLRSRCKVCNIADSRRWQKNNPEKAAARKKKWHDDNREKVAAQKKKYREDNREDLAEKKRLYYKTNPEVRRASNHRYRAKKKANGGTLTAEQVREIQAKDCFWCGTDCAQDFHLDHIVPICGGGRNSRCNIAVSCPSCNLTKGAKDLSDWLREIGWKP